MTIEPKVLKGFRDILPADEIARKRLIEKIEDGFRSYGFVPIDTPVLEYSEVLFGKAGGETEKQVYRFNDNGGRDVAMRFDLTVPFARFIAAHKNDITFPFKRYHIAKAWRGENSQRGRYREFIQCDFDIIGSNSAASDFEILHSMYKILKTVAGEKVNIHINHRGLFNAYLSKLGLLDKSVEILRTVDKLGKLGREETLKLLSEIAGEDKAKDVLDYVGIKGSYEETLDAMIAIVGKSPHTERLALIHRFLLDARIVDSVVLDPSITRGLDYYTGIVFESFFTELQEIGSICSGGRYDNLVGLYSKDTIPGVGTSIGIDRLIAGLEALGRLDKVQTYASIAIACINESSSGSYQALAAKLREKNIPTEVLLEEEKLTRQFQLAEKKGIHWIIIPDAENPLERPLTLRDLRKRENREGLKIEEIIDLVTR